MIFDEIYYDPNRLPEHHVLAKCASICSDWQDYFEGLTFARLILTQSCLPNLRNVFRGEGKEHRQEITSILWLRTILDNYDCNVCQMAEDEETIERYVEFRSPACLPACLPFRFLCFEF